MNLKLRVLPKAAEPHRYLRLQPYFVAGDMMDFEKSSSLFLVRRGKPGGWRDEMGQQLSQSIYEQHLDLMKESNYIKEIQ